MQMTSGLEEAGIKVHKAEKSGPPGHAFMDISHGGKNFSLHLYPGGATLHADRPKRVLVFKRELKQPEKPLRERLMMAQLPSIFVPESGPSRVEHRTERRHIATVEIKPGKTPRFKSGVPLTPGEKKLVKLLNEHLAEIQSV